MCLNRKRIISFLHKYSLILVSVFVIMVTFGNELIRYNPSNGHIEYSRNRGLTWYIRSGSILLGDVRSMVVYGDELILCSSEGVMYSTNKGTTWTTRSSTRRNFVYLHVIGNEILAYSDDGHLYYSTNKGYDWIMRY